MSLPLLAEIDDLAAWLGNSLVAEDDNEERATAVLRAASAAVRRAAGETWVDEEGALADVPEHVWSLTLQVAARMWANPTGARQTTAGPFSTTFEAAVLTDDEVALLTGTTTSTTTGGLWTMGTTRGDLETGVVSVAGEYRGFECELPS